MALMTGCQLALLFGTSRFPLAGEYPGPATISKGRDHTTRASGCLLLARCLQNNGVSRQRPRRQISTGTEHDSGDLVLLLMCPPDPPTIVRSCPTLEGRETTTRPEFMFALVSAIANSMSISRSLTMAPSLGAAPPITHRYGMRPQSSSVACGGILQQVPSDKLQQIQRSSDFVRAVPTKTVRALPHTRPASPWRC